MPMAGFGTRTSDKYEVPKPLIDLYGKYLFEYALDGLKDICASFQTKLTMIMRKETIEYDWERYEFTIPQHINDIGTIDELNIVTLDHPTRGALETVMMGEKYIDDDDICIILDCDLWFKYNCDWIHDNELFKLLHKIEDDNTSIDGFVLGFLSNKDKYSYAKINENKIVKKTAEKQVISYNALMGVYGFSRGKILKEYAKYLLNRESDYNEYYVSAIYNYMIDDGAKILMLWPDDYRSLGTSDEIDEFLKSNNKFKHLYITDFDGTLVYTIRANYLAYKEVFKKIYDYDLSEDDYANNYGLRINELLVQLGLDINKIEEVKKMKSRVYKKYFDNIYINCDLEQKLKFARRNGNVVCLATTASKKNVDNILKHFKLDDFFDYIIYGENVEHGKPDPEVYQKIIMKYPFISLDNVHIYEDSEVGLVAAIRTGIPTKNITRVEL